MINIITINCKLLTAAACNLQRINRSKHFLWEYIEIERRKEMALFDVRYAVLYFLTNIISLSKSQELHITET